MKGAMEEHLQCSAIPLWRYALWIVPYLSTHRTLRHFHSYATSHIDNVSSKQASMGGERERGASNGSNG